MITLYVPPGLSSHIIDVGDHRQGDKHSNTAEYIGRPYRGRTIIDVPRTFLTKLLSSRDAGQWINENPEVTAWLADNPPNTAQYGTAFPGKDRPPLVAALPPAPRPPVKLKAPDGTCSFSHGGVQHLIGDDGTVTVPHEVAEVLAPHGFTAAI